MPFVLCWEHPLWVFEFNLLHEWCNLSFTYWKQKQGLLSHPWTFCRSCNFVPIDEKNNILAPIYPWSYLQLGCFTRVGSNPWFCGFGSLFTSLFGWDLLDYFLWHNLCAPGKQRKSLLYYLVSLFSCAYLVYLLIFQDKVDDVLLGIKSTAIKFGDNTKLWLSGFGTSMVGGLVLSGMSCGIGWPYYASVAAVASHLASQVLSFSMKFVFL